MQIGFRRVFKDRAGEPPQIVSECPVCHVVFDGAVPDVIQAEEFHRGLHAQIQKLPVRSISRMGHC